MSEWKSAGTEKPQYILDLEEEAALIKETELRTGIPYNDLIRLIWQTVEDRLSKRSKHV